MRGTSIEQERARGVILLNRYRIGRFEVIRILETSCPAALASSFYSELDADILAQNVACAAPGFYEPETGKVVLSTHSWLIRGPRHNLHFELGSGNDKVRPNFPRAHLPKTDWLNKFLETGFDVGDIHWVPTFPNATALIGRAEMDNRMPGLRPRPSLNLTPRFASSFAATTSPSTRHGPARQHLNWLR